MYSIEFAAAELMLDPADLQDIFADFFLEATAFFTSCREQLAMSAFPEAAKELHALKGMAANLRMQELSELVVRTEQEIKNQNIVQAHELLGKIHCEIETIRDQVKSYYAE